MIIAKRRSDIRNWPIYHHKIGNDKKMYLNDIQAESSSTNWGSTTPTSSVFSIGSADDINGNGSTYIAYCFAEKKGFSKFGSYSGNLSDDGTFVYTGFKPAWVMIKGSTTAESWHIWNDAVSPSNVIQDYLLANASNAENNSSARAIDFLSNGFKCRTSDNSMNHANTYIYMAFAENPLVTTGKIPATAR